MSDLSRFLFNALNADVRSVYVANHPVVPICCDDNVDCGDGDGYGKISVVMEIKLWDGVVTGKIRSNGLCGDEKNLNEDIVRMGTICCTV